jgi:hypothetical protein
MENVISNWTISELVTKATKALSSKQKGEVVELRSSISNLCIGKPTAVVMLALLMLISDSEEET